MTPQEIQALINEKIAGQGSAVDVGGALPAILSEILNIAAASSANMPKPIVLQRGISLDDTRETLAQIGLTDEEIQAAARGERTGVIFGYSFYNITGASFESAYVWSISYELHIYDQDGTFATISAYGVESLGEDDDLYIRTYEV